MQFESNDGELERGKFSKRAMCFAILYLGTFEYYSKPITGVHTSIVYILYLRGTNQYIFINSYFNF